MLKKKLYLLGILSIENKIIANINFENVIDAFSEQKAREKL